MNKPPLCKLLAFQLVVCLILCGLFGIKGGVVEVLSACLGGLVIVLANGWFFKRLFVVPPGADSAQVLGNFYRAETGKLLVVIALLAIVLTINQHASKPEWFVVEATALFLGFLVQSLLVTVSNTAFIARWLNREFPGEGNQ